MKLKVINKWISIVCAATIASSCMMTSVGAGPGNNSESKSFVMESSRNSKEGEISEKLKKIKDSLTELKDEEWNQFVKEIAIFDDLCSLDDRDNSEDKRLKTLVNFVESVKEIRSSKDATNVARSLTDEDILTLVEYIIYFAEDKKWNEEEVKKEIDRILDSLRKGTFKLGDIKYELEKLKNKRRGEFSGLKSNKHLARTFKRRGGNRGFGKGGNKGGFGNSGNKGGNKGGFGGFGNSGNRGFGKGGNKGGNKNNNINKNKFRLEYINDINSSTNSSTNDNDSNNNEFAKDIDKVIRIQSLFRGHLARKKVDLAKAKKAVRNYWKKENKVQRPEEFALNVPNQNSREARLHEILHGCVERRDEFDKNLLRAHVARWRRVAKKVEIEQAATTIQRFVRERLDRKKLLKNARKMVGNDWNKNNMPEPVVNRLGLNVPNQNSQEARLREILFKRVGRRDEFDKNLLGLYLAKWRNGAKKVEIEQAATKIQRFVRGLSARKKLEHIKEFEEAKKKLMKAAKTQAELEKKAIMRIAGLQNNMAKLGQNSQDNNNSEEDLNSNHIYTKKNNRFKFKNKNYINNNNEQYNEEDNEEYNEDKFSGEDRNSNYIYIKKSNKFKNKNYNYINKNSNSDYADTIRFNKNQFGEYNNNEEDINNNEEDINYNNDIEGENDCPLPFAYPEKICSDFVKNHDEFVEKAEEEEYNNEYIDEMKRNLEVKKRKYAAMRDKIRSENELIKDKYGINPKRIEALEKLKNEAKSKSQEISDLQQGLNEKIAENKRTAHQKAKLEINLMKKSKEIERNEELSKKREKIKEIKESEKRQKSNNRLVLNNFNAKKFENKTQINVNQNEKLSVYKKKQISDKSKVYQNGGQSDKSKSYKSQIEAKKKMLPLDVSNKNK